MSRTNNPGSDGTAGLGGGAVYVSFGRRFRFEPEMFLPHICQEWVLCHEPIFSASFPLKANLK